MISGWEYILILLVVGALVLWGPKKIPELAKAIGEARGEFERASREARVKSPSTVARERKEPSSDDLLIDTARKLEIVTEGKTKDEISAEILEKFRETKEGSE